MLRGLAKGAHREKAPFSGGFEVLTRGEVVAIPKSASDLANLIEWDLQEVFWGPRRSWRAHQAGLYIVDVLRHMLIDADPHPALFDQAVQSMRALGSGSGMPAMVVFQWAVLVECGYEPRLELDEERSGRAVSYGFDPNAGGLVDDPGPGSHGATWRVRRGTVEALRQVRAGVLLDDVSPDQLARAARLLGQYLGMLSGQGFALGDGLFEAGSGSRSRVAGRVR